MKPLAYVAFVLLCRIWTFPLAILKKRDCSICLQTLWLSNNDREAEHKFTSSYCLWINRLWCTSHICLLPLHMFCYLLLHNIQHIRCFSTPYVFSTKLSSFAALICFRATISRYTVSFSILDSLQFFHLMRRSWTWPFTSLGKLYKVRLMFPMLRHN